MFISIEIINVLNIDEILSLMTLKLKVTVEWIDSRLEYYHLKSNSDFNTLTPKEVDKIWIPTLVFTNTKNRQMASFRSSSNAKIHIRKGMLL